MATKLISFSGPNFIGKPLMIDEDFRPAVERMNNFLTQHTLKMFITSSARRQGQILHGTVVPPAGMSNHLIGHAVDMNIMMDGQLFNGDALASPATLPARIRAFFEDIKADNDLHWGIDFNDPVHIDDRTNVLRPDVWHAKFPTIQLELEGMFVPANNPGGPRNLFLTDPLMQGEDVRELQRRLNASGASITPDGFFGGETDKAVTEFQRSKGLTPDGIVGPATLAALPNPVPVGN